MRSNRKTEDETNHNSIERIKPRQPGSVRRNGSLPESNYAEVTCRTQKRRRLSKKERRARKKEKEATRTELTQTHDCPTSNNENKEADVEVMEEKIRLDSMKSYKPIDIPLHPSRDLMRNTLDGENVRERSQVPGGDEGGCRTLGKWFPNAIVMKTISYTNTGQFINSRTIRKGLPENEADDKQLKVENPRSSLVLFYQYTTNDGGCNTTTDRNKKWDHHKLQLLITYVSTISRRRNIGGRIRVATEGVNATLSAVDTSQSTAKAALRHLAEDLRRFSPRVFANTDFKYIDNLPADRHFKDMKILPVKELVYYDIGEDDAPFNPHTENGDDSSDSSSRRTIGGGIHLDAKEYHKMLQKENTVVIDVRNHYETILGRFDGQQHKENDVGSNPKSGSHSSSLSGSGAEYIDPKMRKSTDFKSWLNAPETQEKLSKKTVLMYCTGGIRCERASAYLKKEMGDKVEGVYQLKGGIERYLKTFKDGGFWRGKNFVFDKREAVGVNNPQGDGGVLRAHGKVSKNTTKHSVSTHTDKLLGLAKCCVCSEPWDRYVGKKKCLTCGVPVLMCDKCMSLKPDKTPGMELKVRCSLCVEENVTVLAQEVEFTANGMKSKLSSKRKQQDNGFVRTSHARYTGTNSSTETKIEEVTSSTVSCVSAEKAADTVLKWGGGHALQKKKMKQMSQRPCLFGTNCSRKNCFFYHPERTQN